MTAANDDGVQNRLTAEALLSPFVVAALTVLVVNDHWAKERWPGLITGKVSDFAGLVFFPIALVALLEGLRKLARLDRVAATDLEVHAGAWATAGSFAAVKTSPVVAAWYSDALGAIQWPVRTVFALVGGQPAPAHQPIVVFADPWDLVALPAIAVALWVVARSRPNCPPRKIGPSGQPLRAMRFPA